MPNNIEDFNDWLEHYNNFVRRVAERYKGKVKKWELWNEENEHFFWKPKPNIDQYIKWYQNIYSIIKSIDPSAEIALGGLAGLSCSGQDDYNGKQFLTLLYQRGVFPDIVAIHPYSDTAPNNHVQWSNNYDDIELIRKVMIDYKQGDKMIWVTEWGWSTSKVSQQTQADWIRMSLEMMTTLYPYVTLATYFIDYDRTPIYYHGLFDKYLQAKQAAMVFREFAMKFGQTKLLPPMGFRIQ